MDVALAYRSTGKCGAFSRCTYLHRRPSDTNLCCSCSHHSKHVLLCPESLVPLIIFLLKRNRLTPLLWGSIKRDIGAFRGEKLELDRSNIYNKKKILIFSKKPISEKSSFSDMSHILPTSRICLPTDNVIRNIVFSCFAIVTIDVGRGVRAMWMF